MNFAKLLTTIPYTIDELSTIPRDSTRWQSFLQEPAEEIKATLYPAQSPKVGRCSSVLVNYYWAVKTDIVVVANKSSGTLVFGVPMIFGSYETFAQWLVWRMQVVCNQTRVESDYLKSQLEGLRVKALCLQPWDPLKSGSDRTGMNTDHLDLL